MSIPTSQQAIGVRALSGASLPRAPVDVENAIRQASQETGVDFAYLMEKAAVESDFHTELRASTSSATGLYQFIDSTWLAAMKTHGAEHGLGRLADAIQQHGGSYSVSDPDLRRQILDLRKDPKVSAELAAELTRDNKAYLDAKVGGTIGSTELYLAHFLGAAGAAHFLTAMRDNPGRAARDVTPDAAASNTSIFYDRKTGQPTSLAQVYDRFAKKFGEASSEIVTGSGTGTGTGTATTGSRGSSLAQIITGVANRNPLSALSNTPLSGQTMLALAALETPDEARDKDEQETAYGSRRVSATGTGHSVSSAVTPANDSHSARVTRRAS